MLEHVCGNSQVMDRTIAWICKFQNKKLIEACLAQVVNRAALGTIHFLIFPLSGPAFYFNTKADFTLFQSLLEISDAPSLGVVENRLSILSTVIVYAMSLPNRLWTVSLEP
jgi:hypothetical protein